MDLRLRTGQQRQIPDVGRYSFIQLFDLLYESSIVSHQNTNHRPFDTEQVL